MELHVDSERLIRNGDYIKGGEKLLNALAINSYFGIDLKDQLFLESPTAIIFRRWELYH